MGKSTISMAIFNSYVKLPEGNMVISADLTPQIEFHLALASFLQSIAGMEKPRTWAKLGNQFYWLWCQFHETPKLPILGWTFSRETSECEDRIARHLCPVTKGREHLDSYFGFTGLDL